MYCRNKQQKVVNKTIIDLISEIAGNNEKIANATLNISQHQLDKISFNQWLTSAITSNEIEGIVVSDTNSKDTNVLYQTFIDNYVDALTYIMNNYQTINLSEEEILANHRALYTRTNFPFGGRWKTSSNAIVNAATRTIINKTASVEETPSMMGELIYWYDNEKELPDLIKDCIFLYDFLKIHPFEDANGRTSRLLTNLLFLKAGCSFLKYSSIEEQINLHVDRYYKSLRNRDPQQWFNNDVDYCSWITFNLEIIKCSQQKFLDILNMKNVLTNIKNKGCRIAKWFELNLNQTYNKEEIQTALTMYDISPDTLKKTLTKLVEHNYITKKGNTKGVTYLRSLNNQSKCSYECVINILNPGKAKE